MSVDRERVRDVFFEALERPAEERAAFLAEACGDDDGLLAEVRSLLEHHDEEPLIHTTADTVLVKAADGKVDASADGTARYAEVGPIGKGAFGDVRLEYDRQLERFVARKASRDADARHLAALKREARLLAYLAHPGVVPVYDMGLGSASYTMEVLEGQTLRTRIDAMREAGESFPIPEAIRIVTRVGETLANAHAKGVVHLDVKPDNVMLGAFGHVTVIDWGSAQLHDLGPYRQHLARAGRSAEAETTSGPVSGGTPSYMPPEQFINQTGHGPATDIYAVGTLLYELLAGRLPYDKATDLTKHVLEKLEPPPPVRSFRPQVSERLAAICMRMIAAVPELRPTSLEEVLEELASLRDTGAGTRIIALTAGQVLFERGDMASEAFHVIHGSLAIEVDGEVIATRGPGDVIGELALLSRTERSATVRATEITTVHAIDWSRLESELSRVDPMVGRLLRQLSDKLIETTK